MARTPLADFLQAAAAMRSRASAPGPREDPREERLRTRRQLLRDGAALGAAATGVAALARARPARAASAGNVVVVGAGLAGLSCAYRLKQAGIPATVYEASDRVGGRCWTIRGAFLDNQIAEHGGELIDQGHTAIRNLAHELGLRLDNLLRAEANGTELLGYFDGAHYPEAEIVEELKGIWQKVHSDVSAASFPTTYFQSTPRGRQLDAMSIVDWIEESVPGGVGSRLGRLLDVAYNIEYGGESDVQSSLNLLYLLGYSGQGQLRIFGPSNEKYHVVGGNDQIPTRMAALLAGQISLGHELVAIRQTAGGRFSLTFRNGSGTKTVAADRVVLALPFSILRSSVNYSKAGFKALKQTAIREQGMGTNSKLHVQFTDRHWIPLGSNGETFSDQGYQNSWDVTRAQPGASGILVNYTGGDVGANFGSGTPSSRARAFLQQIEPVLPGISARWNGRATIDFWRAYPWTRGSYSFYKVGQYTKFAGVEPEREGNCFFAGEHTTIEFQGYLNGAVLTGQRAASEILADLE